MFSQNLKGLRPAPLRYRPGDPNNDIFRSRNELHEGVRDLLSPLTAIRRFVNVIIDVAKGRYDR